MSRAHKLVVITIITFLCLLLLASAAMAAQDVGVRVSPTSFNTTIPVGDTTSEIITLQNSSPDEITVRGHVDAVNNPAEPAISIDPEQLSLKPGESAEVVVNLNVPDETQPGNRVASILLEAAASSAREVSIVGQVGVVFNIEVIRPVEDVSWSFPWLVDSGEQAVFGMTGRNSGNFTTRLQGDVHITGITRSDIDLRTVSEPLAIGETADLQAVWDEAPLFAIKKVTLDLSSGVGAPVERQAFLVIFPWKLTLMLTLIAAIAAAGAIFKPFITKVFS